MTISFNGTFSGDLHNEKHKKIIMEMREAFEKILTENQANLYGVKLTERSTETATKDLVSGVSQGSWKSFTWEMASTFHAE